MTTDLERAKSLLSANDLTCAIVKDGFVYEEKSRGVKPLLGLLERGDCPKGASAADKVVGKAAAFLYVLLGVKDVYALVVSDLAAEVFGRFGIGLTYEKRVPMIRNRTDTGFCPMESAVLDIDDPQKAPGAIRKKLAELAELAGK